MTFYAYFDHTVADPSPVTGWIDTDHDSSQLPDYRDLFTMTEVQWNDHMTNPSGWAMSGGALIAYTAPLPLPLQAQLMLEDKLALGITITSVSLSAVDGIYALDSASTGQIFQIGTYANSFGVFPNGGSIQPYPDITGVPHDFSIAVFIAFLQAVASLVSGLQTQSGIMAQGGTPVWPSQSVNII